MQHTRTKRIPSWCRATLSNVVVLPLRPFGVTDQPFGDRRHLGRHECHSRLWGSVLIVFRLFGLAGDANKGRRDTARACIAGDPSLLHTVCSVGRRSFVVRAGWSSPSILPTKSGRRSTHDNVLDRSNLCGATGAAPRCAFILWMNHRSTLPFRYRGSPRVARSRWWSMPRACDRSVLRVEAKQTYTRPW